MNLKRSSLHKSTVLQFVNILNSYFTDRLTEKEEGGKEEGEGEGGGREREKEGEGKEIMAFPCKKKKKMFQNSPTYRFLTQLFSPAQLSLKASPTHYFKGLHI